MTVYRPMETHAARGIDGATTLGMGITDIRDGVTAALCPLAVCYHGRTNKQANKSNTASKNLQRVAHRVIIDRFGP